MRPKRYPYSGEKESTFVKVDPELVEKVLRNTSYLESLQKEDEIEIIPIKSLEIKIDKNSKAPHVVLNGVDFINEKIGLRGLQIVWETNKGAIPEGVVRLDFFQRDDSKCFREISISQSFEGGFIKRE